jgi:DNA-binding HxlR family transcriptional regulator
MVGDWWTPLIIRECLYGLHRFDELQFALDIGRNILSRRLRLLEDEGILERRQYQERPPRYEYHLTEKGYDAARALLAMMPFGERWCFDEGEPIRLYSRSTGKRVRPVVVDEETGERIDPRDLYAGPGPSFPRAEKIRRWRFSEYYDRGTNEG